MRTALDEGDGATQALRDHGQQGTAEAGANNSYIEVSVHKRGTERAAGRVEKGSFGANVAGAARNKLHTSKTVGGPTDRRRRVRGSNPGRNPILPRAR